MKHYDIAICGAGLVGTCLSLALAQQTDKKILLFDSKAESALLTKKHLDTRTLALNKFSQQLLQQLDLWHDLNAKAEAIKTIQISERGSFAKAFLTADDIACDALGYVIEIADLQQVLHQQLAKAGPHLQVLHETCLLKFNTVDHVTQLDLMQANNRQTISCDWLIAADSSQSMIRQQLGIASLQRDYQQTAIASVLQLKHSAKQQAFERFIKEGVLALLPLTDNRCGSVWVMPTLHAKDALALSDKDYCAALQQQFGQQLGPFLDAGPRQHYPLQLNLAERVIQDNIIIIGNAAHTLNPIGAQGLNLGLHDVAGLLQFFKGQLNLNELSSKLLTRNKQLAQVSDSIARLYALDCCPINITRRLGLLTLEHATPFKKHFTKRMMGY